MYKPTFAHTSAKALNIKDYLKEFRSPSKYREEINSRQSRKSPPLSKVIKQQQEQSTQDLIHLQQRYLDLQKSYKQLLEKARIRNMEHNKLKQQLSQYKKMHERDTDQIEKLRCIIGLVNKKSTETQVIEQELQWNGYCRNSRVNKFDQSTQDDIKFKMSSQKFYPNKDKQKPHKDTFKDVTFRQHKRQRLNQSRSKLQQSRVRQSREKTQTHQTNTKGLLLQYEKQLKRVSSGVGRKLNNSPYSQLRFVPGFKK